VLGVIHPFYEKPVPETYRDYYSLVTLSKIEIQKPECVFAWCNDWGRMYNEVSMKVIGKKS
jgi:hypothetical protein